MASRRKRVKLALEATELGGFDEVDRFKRYASLFELHNINVFLGGYGGASEVVPKPSLST